MKIIQHQKNEEEKNKLRKHQEVRLKSITFWEEMEKQKLLYQVNLLPCQNNWSLISSRRLKEQVRKMISYTASKKSSSGILTTKEGYPFPLFRILKQVNKVFVSSTQTENQIDCLCQNLKPSKPSLDISKQINVFNLAHKLLRQNQYQILTIMHEIKIRKMHIIDLALKSFLLPLDNTEMQTNPLAIKPKSTGFL